MHTSPHRTWRGLPAGAALAALVVVSACGTATSPPKQDIGTVVNKEQDGATLDDCLDTSRQPQVATCPYPVQSSDRFSMDHHRRHY